MTQSIQTAMMFHGQGRLAEAERAYSTVLAQDPDQFDALHLLGVLKLQQGNAAAAKLHLQQAFDRKAHVLPGEQMPDPTTDDSILKLKKDKEFWAFAQTLK